MNQAVISLGSNIDPQANIQAAVDILGKEFTVIAKSSFVVTKPLGLIDQADFLNGVVLLATDLEQPALVSRLKALEILLGRTKRPDKWGPREVDLDVLLWNGQIVNKDYYERDFLRNALSEILPDLSRRCY